MIELDGMEYMLQTPGENVLDLVNYINNYCADNQVKDSNGDTMRVEINLANPLYMLLFGYSFLTSRLQRLIFSAGCAINISESSESQLLNLAQIAKIFRKGATRTTVLVTIFAEDETPCTITPQLSATVNGVVFHPAYSLTVPAGENKSIMLIADSYASVSFPEGTITAFDTTVPGLRTITSEAAVPGQPEESIPELRARLLRRGTKATQIDNAAAAIEGLEGVTLCNIYFNYSITDTQMISGIQVPPRQALIIVQGYNDNIAKTFYSHMLCLTAGGSSTRAITQTYVTNAQQQIPVYILPPESLPVYIKVYVPDTLSIEQTAKLKDAVVGMSRIQKIGQAISGGEIIRIISNEIPDINILDIELSKELSTVYT